MDTRASGPLIAIACGGTGGHLYPGLVLADELSARGCDLLVLVSEKELDQQVAKSAPGLRVATLPAVGLERGRFFRFLQGLRASYRRAACLFREHGPAGVIAMGGFTSVAPVLAGRRWRAATFLHEANAVPGRANRWLAHVVDQAFVYFPEAAGRLWNQRVRVTGMPVRPQFVPMEAESCRAALGLDPRRPTLLVTGGSQGASPLNSLVLGLLPALRAAEPELQFIHLTGAADVDRVRAGYLSSGARAQVRPYLSEIELALGAATLALSRAGASSLAEQAAMRLPAILIPYPHAADDHQYHNARAFAESGAARVMRQDQATPERLLAELRHLLRDETLRHGMRAALRQWHSADAARGLAETMLRALPPLPVNVSAPGAPGGLAAARVGLPGFKPADKAQPLP